jgi:hypothetical protein
MGRLTQGRHLDQAPQVHTQRRVAQVVVDALGEEKLDAERKVCSRVAPLVEVEGRRHQPVPQLVQSHLVREVADDPLPDLTFKRWHGRHSV